jgi:aldehyde dehydrogenase (NAD+)
MSVTSQPQLVSGMLIGDEIRTEGHGGSAEHFYPATGELTGEISLGGVVDVDAAVAAAREALPVWEKLGPFARRDLLNRLAVVLESWGDQFEAISSRENGVPRLGFIWRHQLACEWIRTYAGYADKVGGEVTLTSDDGPMEYVRKEPYGVVGIIITWNSPLLSLAMKIPAALAAGNTVVVKPSELTPYTPTLFAKACLEAGFPPGVVNVVTGAGEAGEALIQNRHVEKISFTGGMATATRMMQTGAPLIKPFCFELGGKSAYMIFPDADLELAAGLMPREFSNAGQSCKLGSRIFVHDRVYDQYKDLLLANIAKINIGDPESQTTTMGPVISAGARDRIFGMIAQARDQGQGKLLTGGAAPRLAAPFDDGYFIEPTVFEDVDPLSALGQDEVFGPVVGLFRFSDEDSMVELVNDTQFGLSNYIHTRDLRTAHRVAARVKSGTVYVNDANRRNPGAPFGGFRMSGIGSEGGRAGLDEFLRSKTIGIS